PCRVESEVGHLGRRELRKVPEREELSTRDHGPAVPAGRLGRGGGDACGGEPRTREHPATTQGTERVSRHGPGLALPGFPSAALAAPGDQAEAWSPDSERLVGSR